MDNDNQVTDSVGALSKEEKDFAMFCHLSAFAGLLIPFGSIVGPLVLWLMKREQSEYINYHGMEALNFNITMGIAGLVCVLLMFVFVGIILMFVLGIVWLVLIIMAAVKTND
ncbi:DUF4870 domain-containing protein, partial [Pleionea sp. CnH1-48]|uniref:DUF4870 domain-containing protein n=1 Tax=Pleionea sp. CnH1-48 TaxID=2954494 RepID=UPI002097D1DF